MLPLFASIAAGNGFVCMKTGIRWMGKTYAMDWEDDFDAESGYELYFYMLMAPFEVQNSIIT